jgi:hypothetical protein
MKLPEDKPVKPVLAPHNYFIWGATMSGKSYFASFFPHPLSLNTDGNSEQGTAPSIQIRNIRGKNGKLKQSVITQLDEIITALQAEDNTFQTIIIDVIDDICVMIEQAICIENGVQSLADMPYGKGFALFNSVLQQFVMDLKALPMNVIYISRELENTDDGGNIEPMPSLRSKYYNIVNGNCDLVIHTQKFGRDHYTRTVTDRRAQYKLDDIQNERVRKLLQSCKGMF